MQYPIGIQDFRKLREGGYVYVDKTQHIARVITSGDSFFLSRPRRFGKSLMVSTLYELYSGDASLFAGLWAAEHWDFAAKQRPVIYFQFASLSYEQHGLAEAIALRLKQFAEQFHVVLPGTDYKADFAALLQRVAERSGRRVVVLMDEYDKPIIDYLGHVERAEANRLILRQFYSILKDASPHIELLFITGVSAFSKVSIFSDVNNLKDLTLHPAAADVVGLTEQELKDNFSEALVDVDHSALREWYNGYSWTGRSPKIYNPWSILNFLDHGGQDFRNFWYATGTPAFLIELVRRHRYTDLSGAVVTEAGLTSFDIRRFDPISVMFQTGYLTIVERDQQFSTFTLDYPNREVREAFLQGLLQVYLQEDAIEQQGLVGAMGILQALQAGDVAAVINKLDGIFAVLPYEHWQVDHEFLFHAIVHLVFELVGVHVRSEVHVAGGRCDVIVETADHVYAIELKRDVPAAVALEQILSKGYLRPYNGRVDVKRHAVGISFDTKDKRVGEWVSQTL